MLKLDVVNGHTKLWWLIFSHISTEELSKMIRYIRVVPIPKLYFFVFLYVKFLNINYYLFSRLRDWISTFLKTTSFSLPLVIRQEEWGERWMELEGREELTDRQTPSISKNRKRAWPKKSYSTNFILRFGRTRAIRLINKDNRRSGLSTWKYQFSYDHWSQTTLSSVSTWMGNCASVAWVLLLTFKSARFD